MLGEAVPKCQWKPESPAPPGQKNWIDLLYCWLACGELKEGIHLSNRWLCAHFITNISNAISQKLVTVFIRQIPKKSNF
jgi:hypothetical protein